MDEQRIREIVREEIAKINEEKAAAATTASDREFGIDPMSLEQYRAGLHSGKAKNFDQ